MPRSALLRPKTEILAVTNNLCLELKCSKRKNRAAAKINFATAPPKYRRKVFYGEKRREIGAILRTLCNWKKIRIIEAEVCPDHVHMLVEIPPKVAISSFMGYLKGKSSLMIYEKYPELRYKYRNREFWCRGYYVDTAGKNAKKIEEYIRHQLDEDKAGEQLTMGNF